MIYYQDDEMIIRSMVEDDIQTITDAEITQGWHSERAKQEIRWRDQQEGRAIVLFADWCGEPVGYVSVYRQGLGGPETLRELPEIVDFAVLEKYRRKGIGTRLLSVAERIAATLSDKVYLGVGLHSGYGSAQRMYIKRGYIPDGSGVWYQEQVCEQYDNCCNDDDLVLYLYKHLR